MESVDVTIIGAGIVGLAVASCIGEKTRDVFLLEKNSSYGQETSSRNSEVIHAGIYYKTGSLKAVSCVQGREMLYALCQENGIQYKKCGKLIVATEESEKEYLLDLKKSAAENGVELKLLETSQVKEMEPHVEALAAIYSPETGIVDSHSLMKYYYEKSRAQGVEPVFEAEVVGVVRLTDGYRVDIDNQGERLSIKSRIVINASGHNADKLAGLLGIDIKKAGYEQYYLKGNYFRLSDKYRNTTSHLVYPCPDKNSLGIHTVLDLSGGIRLGPDEEEVERIDYQINESRKQDFYESVKKFLPGVQAQDIYPDTCGIRPQLRHAHLDDFKDFVIADEQERGYPGFINCIGIESPGLTSAPYLAEMIARRVSAYG